MRTKTLLLTAAAMAAGLVSSFAQANVYSVNIVGYANVVIAGNGAYTLLANPFDDGNGNQVTNILNSALPKQSQLLTWNGSTFNVDLKGGSPAQFATSFSLPPGVGFFIKNGATGSGAPAVTNTFVGSVIVPSGGSATNDLPVGFTLQGLQIPYSGNLAIAGQAGGDANMDFGTPLAKQAQILTWNGATFNVSLKGGSPATWSTTASIGVGTGFFINNKNGPATNVVMSLP